MIDENTEKKRYKDESYYHMNFFHVQEIVDFSRKNENLMKRRYSADDIALKIYILKS